MGDLKYKYIADGSYTPEQIDTCIQHYYATLDPGTYMMRCAVNGGTSYVYLNKHSDSYGNYQRASYWDTAPTYVRLESGSWKIGGRYVTNSDLEKYPVNMYPAELSSKVTGLYIGNDRKFLYIRGADGADYKIPFAV